MDKKQIQPLFIELTEAELTQITGGGVWTDFIIKVLQPKKYIRNGRKKMDTL